MLWFLATAALVLAIAAGAFFWVTNTLSQTAATAVYDIKEATEWIGDRLPTAVAAKLSFGDVEDVLLWHLDYLRHQGMATFGGVDLDAQEAALGGDDVVTHEDEAVDAVLSSASAAARDIDAVDVVVVLALNNQYLDAIGALGASREL